MSLDLKPLFVPTMIPSSMRWISTGWKRVQATSYLILSMYGSVDRMILTVKKHCSSNPDGSMLVAVGDFAQAILLDRRSKHQIHSGSTHEDFSFSSSWHPHGTMFATASQDTTTKIWDLRRLDQHLLSFDAHMSAFRSVQFSCCGKFLFMGESADFVHIVEMDSWNRPTQTIDVYGELAGVSVSPESDFLFVGVTDSAYGCLSMFQRVQQVPSFEEFLL